MIRRTFLKILGLVGIAPTVISKIPVSVQIVGPRVYASTITTDYKTFKAVEIWAKCKGSSVSEAMTAVLKHRPSRNIFPFDEEVTSNFQDNTVEAVWHYTENS